MKGYGRRVEKERVAYFRNKGQQTNDASMTIFGKKKKKQVTD